VVYFNFQTKKYVHWEDMIPYEKTLLIFGNHNFLFVCLFLLCPSIKECMALFRIYFTKHEVFFDFNIMLANESAIKHTLNSINNITINPLVLDSFLEFWYIFCLHLCRQIYYLTQHHQIYHIKSLKKNQALVWMNEYHVPNLHKTFYTSSKTINTSKHICHLFVYNHEFLM